MIIYILELAQDRIAIAGLGYIQPVIIGMNMSFLYFPAIDGFICYGDRSVVGLPQQPFKTALADDGSTCRITSQPF